MGTSTLSAPAPEFCFFRIPDSCFRRPQMYDTSKRVRVKSRRLAVLYYFISLAGAPSISSPRL